MMRVATAGSTEGQLPKFQEAEVLIRETLAALQAEPHALPADDSWCQKFAAAAEAAAAASLSAREGKRVERV